MHYLAPGFKSADTDQTVSARLELCLDESLQCQSHRHWHVHLAARAEAASGGDGLSVGADEFLARRTVSKMVIEPARFLGVERSLRVIEEQAMNVAAAKLSAEKPLNTIHRC